MEIESALHRHFATQREEASGRTVERLSVAMLQADERAPGDGGDILGAAAFVAAQVRYIPPWTWAAQAAIVALMFAMAFGSGNLEATKLVIGILSVATVLVGVPTVHASKRHGVAELECSCRNNVASVLVARLIVLGCSSSLSVALMVGVTAAAVGIGAFDAALWACLPFFCASSGALAILRKSVSQTAPALCVVWGVACSVALMLTGAVFPQIYGHASLAMWAAASMAALIWLVREVVATLSSAAAGLDVYAAHLARTYQ